MSDGEQSPEQDDEDSNRESNPDYDYPEEDYQDGDSDDEGVINRDYYAGGSDEEEMRGEGSEGAIDEEEIYRRYLNRCKNDKNSADSDDEYF